MVVWQGFLETAALGMGVTATQAGLILSLVLSIALIIVVTIADGGKSTQVTIPAAGLMGMLLFLALGWMPTILGTIVALIFALFIVQIIMNPRGA